MDKRSLLAFGCTSLGAILTGLFFPMASWTEKFIIVLGYASVATCFSFFVYILIQSGRPWKGRIEGLRRPDLLGPLMAVLATTVWLLSIEPFMFKIVADELLIAANSQGMHLARAPAIPQSSNWSNGHFVMLEAFLDKRPFLLPFLVSVLHDLTGYRLANVFVLNSLLTLGFLTVSFSIINRVAGRTAAYGFLILVGFLPVLAQGATSGNASILNITLLATSIALAIRYWDKPDKVTLIPLVYALLLLAQARYESALYIFPFGIVILLGWKKAGRIILPPSVIVAPFFLVLNVIHQRYTIEYGGFYWQSGPTDNRADTFSLRYLPQNLKATWEFLFHMRYSQLNSIILSVAGISGLFILLTAWLRNQLEDKERFLIGIVLALFLCNAAVVLFFNYGLFIYQSTSRLSLPMCFFLAVFGSIAFCKYPRKLLETSVLIFVLISVLQTLSFDGFAWREEGWYVATGLVVAVAGGIALLKYGVNKPVVMLVSLLVLSLGVMAPKMRANYPFYDYVYNRKFHYYLDFIRENGGTDVLFLCRTPYFPTLLEQNSMAPLKFIGRRDEATEALLSGHYRKIYFLHGVSPDEDKEPPVRMEVLKELLPDLDIVLADQRRFSKGHMVIIHELGLKDDVRNPPEEVPELE